MDCGGLTVPDSGDLFQPGKRQKRRLFHRITQMGETGTGETGNGTDEACPAERGDMTSDAFYGSRWRTANLKFVYRAHPILRNPSGHDT